MCGDALARSPKSTGDYSQTNRASVQSSEQYVLRASKLLSPCPGPVLTLHTSRQAAMARPFQSSRQPASESLSLDLGIMRAEIQQVGSVFSTTYRVAPVANSTTKHNKAALGHAKLTQEFKGIYAALRRLSACDKSQVDCRFIHNRAEVPRASPRSSAASAVTPRLPRTNSLSRALVHPIFRAKAACVIFPG